MRYSLVCASVCVVSACLPPPAGNPVMWGHFDAAADLNEAVIAGDLMRIQLAGGRLAGAELERVPNGAGPFLDRIRLYGGQLAETRNLEMAASGTAGVARACGDCHREFGPGPDFRGGGAPPREGEGIRREMKRHAWGAGRLWEGLVGPSDAAWASGTRALVEVPLVPQGSFPPGVYELEGRVHELARTAVSAGDAETRSHVYGELITTCTTCHGMVRRGP